jgi:6-pyruvoyltetrahydropterin/6-carboxytetrahydropterin synthase
LQSIFDHKLLVAEDDPEIQSFKAMRIQGIADIVILPDVGCEKFSELVYYEADRILQEMGEKPRVRVKSVRVSEHEGNSAIYTRD